MLPWQQNSLLLFSEIKLYSLESHIVFYLEVDFINIKTYECWYIS